MDKSYVEVMLRTIKRLRCVKVDQDMIANDVFPYRKCWRSYSVKIVGIQFVHVVDKDSMDLLIVNWLKSGGYNQKLRLDQCNIFSISFVLFASKEWRDQQAVMRQYVVAKAHFATFADRIGNRITQTQQTAQITAQT